MEMGAKDAGYYETLLERLNEVLKTSKHLGFEDADNQHHVMRTISNLLQLLADLRDKTSVSLPDLTTDIVESLPKFLPSSKLQDTKNLHLSIINVSMTASSLRRLYLKPPAFERFITDFALSCVTSRKSLATPEERQVFTANTFGVLWYLSGSHKSSDPPDPKLLAELSSTFQENFALLKP